MNPLKLVITLRLRQNGRHFADDIFKYIFLNENVKISINISSKFVPKGQINNIAALVQMIAWQRPVDKPLSEPMMFSLLSYASLGLNESNNHSKTKDKKQPMCVYDLLHACTAIIYACCTEFCIEKVWKR